MLKFGRNPIFEVLEQSFTPDFNGGFLFFGSISDTHTWVLWVLEWVPFVKRLCEGLLCFIIFFGKKFSGRGQLRFGFSLNAEIKRGIHGTIKF